MASATLRPAWQMSSHPGRCGACQRRAMTRRQTEGVGGVEGGVECGGEGGLNLITVVVSNVLGQLMGEPSACIGLQMKSSKFKRKK